MGTRIVRIAVMLMVGSGMAGPPVAAQRPDWAEKVPVFGTLLAQDELPGDFPRVAGNHLRLAAQDARGRIYVLRPGVLQVEVYRPDGRAWDGFTLPQPARGIGRISAFAVEDRGDLFALADGAFVHVVDRRRVITTIPLPFIATDLAFSGGELLVARVPARMVQRDGKSSLEEDRDVVLRFGTDGEELGPAWSCGQLEGPNPGLAAMTNQFLLAAGRRGALWIGRCAGTLELFYSRRGRRTKAWRDPGIGEAATFPGSAPETVEKDMQAFTEEARARMSFWHAPVTIRDLTVHDDLAWVLLRAGTLAEDPVVAIFEEGRETALGYLALGGGVGDFADLAVTDEGLWVIPRQGSEPVRYFERIPDTILMEMAASWGRRRKTPPDPR